MRKIVTLLLGLLTINLSSCSLFYATEIDDGNFHYVSGGIKSDAFCYEIDFDGSNYKLEIPETINEYKITKLGGYYGRGYPMPFSINIFDYEIKSRNLLKEDYEFFLSDGKAPSSNFNGEIIYRDFELFISKNIKEIFYRNNAFQVKIKNEEYCFVTRFRVNVAKENKYFYSSDGILYEKNGDVFSNFLYF